MKHQIYLIPGFFGFASIGGIAYFRQVRETLHDVFAEHGLEVEYDTRRHYLCGRMAPEDFLE